MILLVRHQVIYFSFQVRKFVHSSNQSVLLFVPLIIPSRFRALNTMWLNFHFIFCKILSPSFLLLIKTKHWAFLSYALRYFWEVRRPHNASSLKIWSSDLLSILKAPNFPRIVASSYLLVNLFHLRVHPFFTIISDFHFLMYHVVHVLLWELPLIVSSFYDYFWLLLLVLILDHQSISNSKTHPYCFLPLQINSFYKSKIRYNFVFIYTYIIFLF